jgi:hypothetical protein
MTSQVIRVIRFEQRRADVMERAELAAAVGGFDAAVFMTIV